MTQRPPDDGSLTDFLATRLGEYVDANETPFDGLTRAAGERGADLGDAYEDHLSSDERAAHGQFYTPTAVADAVVQWCVRGGPGAGSLPRVLDPAAGSGAFTAAAYRRLASVAPAARHQELLNRVVSLDVNRVPLYLTALDLARQRPNESTEAVFAYHDSFFDVDPGTGFDSASRIDGGGTGSFDADAGAFDAVVGNPPYIRHENLDPDKEHFRSHLAAFGPDDRTPYYDGCKSLSKKCDAYIYFVTHATQFLREGGRLGYVIPTKWLMTRYGDRFQTFLYDHYKVHAVVGFAARAFEDALVDTALLLAERCDDAAERRATTTRFVRVKDELDPAAIVDVVDATDRVGDDELLVRNRSSHRVVAVSQAALEARDSAKLAHFLTAPQALVELGERPSMVSLSELASVSYGNKTGANDFFFLDEADRDDWPIDDRFLGPAIKTYRDVKGHTVTRDDVGLALLDVHEYVEAVARDAGDGTDLEARVEAALERDGYDVLAAYVAHGEAQGYHERSTLRSRAVWFDLGDLKRPEVLHPKFFDERVTIAWNPDRLAPSNAIDGVYLDADVDGEVVTGVLSSTVHKAMLEFWGRAEGGGALQLMTYELEDVPVPDVRAFSEAHRREVVAAYRALTAGEDGAQRRLDAAVLDAVGSSLDADTLREMRDAVAHARIEGAKDATVLVSPLDAFDEPGTRRPRRGDGGSD